MNQYPFIPKFINIFILIFIFSFFFTSNLDQVTAEDKNLYFSNLSAYELIPEYNRIIELILLPSITNSINKVYGENQRGIDEYEVLEIERGYYPSEFDYRIKIKFRTYFGPHNPPFDENIAIYDIINFSPLTIKEISFEHHIIKN